MVFFGALGWAGDRGVPDQDAGFGLLERHDLDAPLFPRPLISRLARTHTKAANSRATAATI